MNATTLLIGVLPLVLFVLVDIYAGVRSGVYAAIGAAVLLFIYFAFKLDGVDMLMVSELVLICLLGALTIKLNRSIFFKFQPVVIGVLIGLIFAGFHIFDEPYLVKQLPRIAALSPQVSAIMDSPEHRHYLERMITQLSLQWIFIFPLHAAIIAYAAIKMKNLAWIIIRLAIYPVIVVQMFLNALI